MIAFTATDARFLREVGAHLCRASRPQGACYFPVRLDPEYQAVRRASGRRELLKNLEAATRRLPDAMQFPRDQDI